MPTVKNIPGGEAPEELLQPPDNSPTLGKKVKKIKPASAWSQIIATDAKYRFAHTPSGFPEPSVPSVPPVEDPDCSGDEESPSELISTGEELPLRHLTPKQWAALPDKGKWDIQVALRGPDSYYGEVLKWYTTGVIRGHSRNVMRVGGSVNKDLRMVVCPIDHYHTHDTKTKTSWNAAHFLEHIHAAASWLNIPILQIDAKRWHEIMSGGSVTTAGAEILEEAKKQKYPQQHLIKELERHLKSGLRGY